MKAYLIISLLSMVMGLAAPQPKKPPSDRTHAFAQLLRIGFSAWAIYLLYQL